jgi:hypothetical protein
MKNTDIQSHINPILWMQGGEIKHTVKVTYLGKGIYGCRCFLNGVLNSEYRAKGKKNIGKACRELLRWESKMGNTSKFANRSREAYC